MTRTDDVAADIDRAVAGRTLLDALEETARRYGEVPALSWRSGPQWTSLTWRELRGEVEVAARGLLGLGVAPGERVGILMSNRPELAIADLAVLHARAVPVCLFDSFTGEQLASVLDTLGIGLVIAGGAAELDRLTRAAGRPIRSVVVEPGDGAAGSMSWERLMADGRARAAAGDGALDASRRAARPDDVVSVNYTSGTTGSLKGVQHTHRNVLWHAESFARFVDVPAGTRFLAYLPRAHATERFVTTWFPLTRGGTVHLCPDPAQLGDYLPEVRPQFFGGVLRVWERMYAAATASIAADPALGPLVTPAIEVARAAARLPGGAGALTAEQEKVLAAGRPLLREIRARLGLDDCWFAFSGGGALAEEVQEFFNALGVPLTEGWGQSELLSAATCGAPGRIRIGTVGSPLPGVAVRESADGELLVRSGSRMRGYVDASLDGGFVDPQGWVHTGDLGEIGPDGYVRVSGRRGDVLRLADGYPVPATRVESQLKANLLVDHACVVGEGRPDLCALLVIGAPGDRWGLDGIAAIVRECNRRLPARQRISRFAVLHERWEPGRSEELTHTGKLKRSLVGAKHADLVESLCRGRSGVPVPGWPEWV
jgi:long-chain acyl-CoA synthetase